MKVLRAFSFLIGFMAVFAPPLIAAPHALVLNTDGHGTVSANPTAVNYPHNSTVTLTANASNGWVFQGWSGDLSGTQNPTNLFIDSDKAVTAHFSPISSYTLTVGISGQGAVEPAGGTYLSNTVVQLGATPSNGWVFHQWEGDVSGSANPLALTMTSHKSVTAVFFQPINFGSEPQDGVAVPGGMASFSVGASGSGPLGYAWFFNDSPLSGATSSTLTLTNLQLAQAGNYRVVVTSPYHSLTSRVATLTVSCVGTNVVSVATDAALRAAIHLGGHVRLCFNGTLVLSNTIDVQKDVILDGTGVEVILSGNNAVRLFNISSNITFTISNLTLANGLSTGTNGADAGAVNAQHGEPAVGGAFYNAGGSLSLISCTLSNNRVRGGNGGTGNINRKPNGTGGDASGGAVYNAGGTVFFQNVIVAGNEARGGAGGTYHDGMAQKHGQGGAGLGGVVYSAGGFLLIADSLLTNNLAWAAPGAIASGGALHQSNGFVTVTNSMFLGNHAVGSNANGAGTFAASDGARAEGGAITGIDNSGQILSTEFRNNLALGGNAVRSGGKGEAFGGAIYNSGDLRLARVDVSANAAHAGAGGSIQPASAWGGGIFNRGSMVLLNSTILSNVTEGSRGYCVITPTGLGGTPAFGGGVCLLSNATAYITNCTIGFNRVSGGQGCTFGAGSGGAYGGGIFADGGELRIGNTTIAMNTVESTPSFQTGPVVGANLAQTNSDVRMYATLLTSQGTNGNVWGVVIDDGYNFSSDASANFASGSSFNFTDPRLLPLANNGGPTLTMALATDSPAIDWAPVAGGPSTDQRGFPRPFGSGADPGAFELGPPVPSLRVVRSGDSVQISLLGQAGIRYRIERSSFLTGWETVEAIGPLASTGTVARTFPVSGPRAFYRLAVDW